MTSGQKSLKYIFFAAIALLLICISIKINIKSGQPTLSNPLTAQVYIDIATNPTLLQMIDMISQDSATPKLFAWRRFHGISDRIDLTALNATDLLQEHPFTYDGYDKKFEDLIIKGISDFLIKNPNYQFEFHLNAYHAHKMNNILSSFKEQIKTIHLYEDSFLRWMWDSKIYMLPKFEKYPHYMHYAFLNFLPPDSKKKQEEKSAGVPIIWHYLNDIANQLTPSQKRDLSALTHFDYDFFAKKMANKKTAVFTFGYTWNNNDFDTRQINLFKQLYRGELPLAFYPDDYIWLYKEHPWKTNNDFIKKEMAQFPNVLPIPQQTPMEMFILTGLIPDKVFGYSSSLFFSFKPQNILGYIPRDNDPYLTILKQYRIISDKQIFKLNTPLTKQTVSAFVRVKNEIKTLPACLNSIDGLFDRIIILFSNEPDDGSIAYIKKWCTSDKKCEFIEYPHRVYPSHDAAYQKPVDHQNTLSAYNEFGLNHFYPTEWVVKIDADQVYLTNNLKEFIAKIKETPLNKSISYYQTGYNTFVRHNKLVKWKSRPINGGIDCFATQRKHILKPTQNQYYEIIPIAVQPIKFEKPLWFHFMKSIKQFGKQTIQNNDTTDDQVQALTPDERTLFQKEIVPLLTDSLYHNIDF